MHPIILTTHPRSEPLSLTDEYLGGLPVDKLIDLLLHRTNLVLVSTKNHISDLSYIESLKKDLTKIYAAIKSHGSNGDPASY